VRIHAGIASGSAPALRDGCAECHLRGSSGSPVRGGLEDSGNFDQEAAAPGRELAEFGYLQHLTRRYVTATRKEQIADDQSRPAAASCRRHDPRCRR
jgi:hypothetical protein